MAFTVQVEMVNYDHVRDRACISYMTSKGMVHSLWIHRTTFDYLMNGYWDSSRLGDPNIYQKDMREALRLAVKDNYMEWFTDSANKIMAEKTKQPGKKG